VFGEDDFYSSKTALEKAFRELKELGEAKER